ncbi:MAG: hypothetical protein HFJ48_00645 [Clostridia bacterium]|nr:hypothetical protein [Clostridia bacterium]
MENENTLNRTICRFSEKTDIIQAIIIGLIAFLVPSFLAQFITVIFGADSIITNNSQILVGSVVNTALIISAFNVKGWKKIVGIVTMPSISTILSGYVFKTASVFMVYMIPAIWLGNFALIYFYKFIMMNKNKNYFLAGFLGIAVKVLIIFSAFNILNLFNIFPTKLINNLQTAMGVTQLITATIGMIIAFIIYKVEKAKLS